MARFYLQTETPAFDVLLVDGFDHAGQPAALCTQRFYDDCFAALRADGVLVVNLHYDHPDYPLWGRSHQPQLQRQRGRGPVRGKKQQHHFRRQGKSHCAARHEPDQKPSSPETKRASNSGGVSKVFLRKKKSRRRGGQLAGARCIQLSSPNPLPGGEGARGLISQASSACSSAVMNMAATSKPV